MTKHMDMRYHWIQDRCEQKQFIAYWAPGSENLGAYFTKHHHPIIHRRMRSKYVKDPTIARLNNCNMLMSLLADARTHSDRDFVRGCIDQLSLSLQG